MELPQPATASITSILTLKTSYFAYWISFLVCANLWKYHHVIYSHVEKIDSKIIWLNIMLMFTFSLIPYLTIFVSNNQNSLIAQLLYGVDFIIINIILFSWQNHYLTQHRKWILKKCNKSEKCNIHTINTIHNWMYHSCFRISCCNKHLLFDNNSQVNYLFT